MKKEMWNYQIPQDCVGPRILRNSSEVLEHNSANFFDCTSFNNKRCYMQACLRIIVPVTLILLMAAMCIPYNHIPMIILNIILNVILNKNKLPPD